MDSKQFGKIIIEFKEIINNLTIENTEQQQNIKELRNKILQQDNSNITNHLIKENEYLKKKLDLLLDNLMSSKNIQIPVPVSLPIQAPLQVQNPLQTHAPLQVQNPLPTHAPLHVQTRLPVAPQISQISTIPTFLKKPKNIPSQPKCITASGFDAVLEEMKMKFVFK